MAARIAAPGPVAKARAHRGGALLLKTMDFRRPRRRVGDVPAGSALVRPRLHEILTSPGAAVGLLVADTHVDLAVRSAAVGTAPARDSAASTSVCRVGCAHRLVTVEPPATQGCLLRATSARHHPGMAAKSRERSSE
jgi:hypothetical protein